MLGQVPDHQFAELNGDFVFALIMQSIILAQSSQICYQLIGIPTSGAVFGTAG